MVVETPALLEELLKPLQLYLQNPAISEISINTPGEVWIEEAGNPVLERYELPILSAGHLRRLAFQIAAWTGQSISPEKPLLSARLPSGERVQIMFPPAAPGGPAYAIRKQVTKDFTLADYAGQGAFEGVKANGETEADPLRVLLEEGKTQEFLEQAVLLRKNILIVGGTSSGKTTFARALLKVIPVHERLITIEDTQELFPAQPNTLSLVASKGEQGAAKVTVQDLLEASLRLRPDRILLGELRGSEAYSFLRAVNTGHPGTITTIHANSPQGAFEQLAMMVMQARLGLTKEEIMAYVRGIVDVVVHLERVHGERKVVGLLYGRE